MSKASTAAKNAAAAAKLKARIAEQVKKGAGKGLEAGIRFLAARIKEAVSVPAPRKAVWVNRGGIYMKEYRATTDAIKGAPPRKLSGRLRQSITHAILTPFVAVVGTNARAVPSRKYPQGFNYPAYHELGTAKGGKGGWGKGKHKFIKPTVEQYRKELRIIVGSAIRAQLRIKR